MVALRCVASILPDDWSASTAAARGTAGLKVMPWWSGEKLNVQLRQAPMRTTGAKWGTSAMGRSACLSTHGVVCGGTSDAVAWEL